MDGSGDVKWEASGLEWQGATSTRGLGSAVRVAAIRTRAGVLCTCVPCVISNSQHVEVVVDGGPGQVLGMRAPSVPEAVFPRPAFIPGLLVVSATLPVPPLSALSGQQSDLYSWVPRGAVCLSD